MIDRRHPLAALATRMPLTEIESAPAPCFAHQDRHRCPIGGLDLFGPTLQVAGASTSPAGLRHLPIRLMIRLPYLKHAFGESDETVVQRWAENPYLKAIAKKDLERGIVDSTVSEKAIALLTDSRLLDVTRRKLVLIAKRAGVVLRQTFEKEGRSLRRRAGGYAHAKQCQRLRRVLKRQRTILGRVMGDLERRLPTLADGMKEIATLRLERARHIHTQRPKDKNKRYALHAQEVEYIGKGKARQPCDSHRRPGLSGRRRAWDRDHPPRPDQEPKHQDPRLLKRRQAVERVPPLKDDCGLRRNWLKVKRLEGDGLHPVLCAAGHNLCWLMRAIARLGLKAFFCALASGRDA